MAATTESQTKPIAGTDEPTRRDFIHILSVAVAGAGAAAVVVPLVDQMNPDASVRALSTKDIDISAIAVGQAIKVMWQGKPVFIRRRTPEEIKEAEATPLSALKDPQSRNENAGAGADAEDKNRAIKPEFMVLVGVCTHLGCIPLGTAQGETRGDFHGWFCPCHGSHYDVAGRIRKGPAPENLHVPPYAYTSDTVIKIG
ncbi:MAG: ubiquinol-cytochrome c reductase iron-sulfur subunit [Parvularculaceae bacterium]|nr:ubiquinol-cytochrome c reductase iron-sulfur subunit [Parvularculaceae bacterium]